MDLNCLPGTVQAVDVSRGDPQLQPLWFHDSALALLSRLEESSRGSLSVLAMAKAQLGDTVATHGVSLDRMQRQLGLALLLWQELHGVVQ